MIARMPSRAAGASDKEIVVRSLEGDEDACRELVERFERPVFGVVLRVVRDREVAEDLTQETFVKAFRHLDRYDPSRKLASWLFKIGHNTAIDYLRRKRADTVPIHGEVDDDVPAVRLEGPRNREPDVQVESKVLAEAIDRALDRLRPAYRQALVLRFQEGLAYQEIAEVLGVPIGTVKVHLHRARKQLAAALDDLGWNIEPDRETPSDNDA